MSTSPKSPPVPRRFAVYLTLRQRDAVGWIAVGFFAGMLFLIFALMASLVFRAWTA